MIQRICLLSVALLLVVEIFSGILTTALNPTDNRMIVYQGGASSMAYSKSSAQLPIHRSENSDKRQSNVPRFTKNPNNADIFVSTYRDVDNDYYERNQYIASHRHGKPYDRRFWNYDDRNAFLNIKNIDSWVNTNVGELQATHATFVEYFNERAILDVYQEPTNNVKLSSAVPEPSLLAMLFFCLLGVGFKKCIMVWK